MSLLDTAIWWHVYPLGACGAPIRGDHGVPAHRLGRLENWLDYVIELGCSGVLLGPVFASATHGYDTLDYYAIDPRLGDDADFDRFVAAARDRGLSVLLDGVFNHVGIGHAAVESGTMIKRAADGGPVGWERHGDLAELDHSRPEVADLVVDVMRHWLRRGIAGWRLDVAYAVPATFWRNVIERVRGEFPDAIFLGEVIRGDYAEIAREGRLDSITQYELWKAIWSSVKDRNFWELAHGIERHAAFSESLVLNTFAGNHDVDRVASLVGDAGAALAAAIVMTLPGMPSIYYGDEQAFRGMKGSGFEADDALRPELPDAPDLLSSNGLWMYRLYQDLIGLRRRHPWLTRARVEVLDKTNTSLAYAATAHRHRLTARLALDPLPRFEIDIDGAPGLAWTAGPELTVR